MCQALRCYFCIYYQRLHNNSAKNHYYPYSRASQVVLVVKNLPANAGDMRDAIQSLGWEDPLEKGRATHSSFLAWEIPWTQEPGGLQSSGLKTVGHELATKQQ